MVINGALQSLKLFTNQAWYEIKHTSFCQIYIYIYGREEMKESDWDFGGNLFEYRSSRKSEVKYQSYETTISAYETPDSNIKLVYLILKHSQKDTLDMHYFMLKEVITPNLSHLKPVTLKIRIHIFPSNICYHHRNTAWVMRIYLPTSFLPSFI